MSYSKTTWVDKVQGVSPGTDFSAANMNKIEDAVEELDTALASLTSEFNNQIIGSKIYAYKNLGGF